MDTIIDEQFRHIEGYDNYEISNLGVVKNKKTGLILKQFLRGRGEGREYYNVNLCKDGFMRGERIHRLVGNAFIENLSNKPCIDHIDNNKLNNNVSNLRFCTNSENHMNTPPQKNNTSGKRGVYWDKYCEKWRANIKVNGKRFYLGSYQNIDDAILSREKAEETHFKEFRYCV
jgi:hypothetical protein